MFEKFNYRWRSTLLARSVHISIFSCKFEQFLLLFELLVKPWDLILKLKWLARKKSLLVRLKLLSTIDKFVYGVWMLRSGISLVIFFLGCNFLLDFLFSLRGSRVLLVGLTGLGAEVAKNLTLSGIKSLTLLDHRVARKGSANFLVPESSIGKNVCIFFKTVLVYISMNIFLRLPKHHLKEFKGWTPWCRF